MIRAVIDSNVLVSGIVRRDRRAAPVQVLDAWRAGEFELAISEIILEEVSRTLRKPYFRARLSDDQIERALLLLRRRARTVSLEVEVQGIATHPEDDLILATALSAQAEWLVTGDAALLALGEHGGVQIRSPRDFVHLLQSQT